jgi:type III restriction enzyme
LQDDQVEYVVEVKRGFSELLPSAYSANGGEPALDYRMSPPDKSNMARYLFTGFRRRLYEVQKFQSDSERKLAVVLEREAQKWFKPVKGQFKLYYRSGIDELEYQPDFVAETEDAIFMLEPTAANTMTDPDVLAKKAVAEEWCRHATTYAATCEGKPWKYVLIPHDAIAENMTLEGLARAYFGNSDG